MELKNIEEVLKLQKDFTTKLSENVKVLRGNKPPSVKLVLKEKEAQLKEVKQDLEIAAKDRVSFIARMDERIERYVKSQAQLEKEIEKLKDSIKPTPKPPTRGRRKTKKE